MSRDGRDGKSGAMCPRVCQHVGHCVHCQTAEAPFLLVMSLVVKEDDVHGSKAPRAPAVLGGPRCTVKCAAEDSWRTCHLCAYSGGLMAHVSFARVQYLASAAGAVLVYGVGFVRVWIVVMAV